MKKQRITQHRPPAMGRQVVPAWIAVLAAPLFLSLAAQATEFHVAVHGDDANPGTRRAPLRTIQRAADLSQPGDVITVHEGTYRERVNPPRGGDSDSRRIVYQAAPREKVEITGSEVVKGWVQVQEGVWKVTLPNSFFGGFNPFADLIHGDWFDPRGRQHHTAAVYLDGDWLTEATRLDEVLAPFKDHRPDPAKGRGLNPLLWFAVVDKDGTTVWAQFSRLDPNKRRVEVNVRRTVFYPDQPGRNFITVRGFTMRCAATPWAPPTAEQVGLIGTHWSKGWIIEDNVISYSTCCGISLGKHGDAFDNTSANTAEGYVKTVERAHAFGIPWTRENIGHHVVRNNTITHCEQAGIVGSLGAAFSTVTCNTIHDIHIRRLFGGAEMAGIKFHAAIDSTIRHNHIYHCCQGLWLDWMAQGTRVTGNLFHDNEDRDLFLEVNHGPFLVDNNLFLSGNSLLDVSEGGAFCHNLFCGRIISQPEPNRQTPYHPSHSTEIAGLASVQGGDHRFTLNCFVGSGLSVYDGRPLPLQTAGNVYCLGARPYRGEERPLMLTDRDPAIQLIQKADHEDLRITLPLPADRPSVPVVTTEQLGKATISGLSYVNPDDSPLRLDTDYLGKRRSDSHPTPGPFEHLGKGPQTFRVW